MGVPQKGAVDVLAPNGQALLFVRRPRRSSESLKTPRLILEIVIR
jgi:hypothetical protein